MRSQSNLSAPPLFMHKPGLYTYNCQVLYSYDYQTRIEHISSSKCTSKRGSGAYLVQPCTDESTVYPTQQPRVHKRTRFVVQTQLTLPTCMSLVALRSHSSSPYIVPHGELPQHAKKLPRIPQPSDTAPATRRKSITVSERRNTPLKSKKKIERFQFRARVAGFGRPCYSWRKGSQGTIRGKLSRGVSITICEVDG